MATMKQFKVGMSYQMRSACDHDCVWRFVVTGRTAQTIRILEEHKTKPVMCIIKKSLSEYRGAESVMPFGSYSMAPILSADNSINE